MLWELLERGVQVYYQPPPFVHSKLFYVDDDYAQIGSANFDSRSLRLNFEMNVEVYDRDTVTELARHFEGIRARSRRSDAGGRRRPRAADEGDRRRRVVVLTVPLSDSCRRCRRAPARSARRTGRHATTSYGSAADGRAQGARARRCCVPITKSSARRCANGIDDGLLGAESSTRLISVAATPNWSASSVKARLCTASTVRPAPSTARSSSHTPRHVRAPSPRPRRSSCNR